MTNDEKDFEEFLPTQEVRSDIQLRPDVIQFGRECWMESRRTLREKMTELESDLKLNASMLARQTDIAREAEIRVKELEEGIEKAWQLSTWAAYIKWSDKEKNTSDWLEDLRERIEKFQKWHKGSMT